MPDIRMADVSEFQDNVDAPAYIAAGHEIIICRTYNGNRPDHKMPGRRDYLRAQPFKGIGWYAYLEPGPSAEQQAHQFVQTIGHLGPNEWPILDHEQGAGDQRGRAQAWFNVVDAWAGFPAMLYAGDYFLTANLGGSSSWQGRPIWIASYGSREPVQAHTLWQFADNYPFPGIGRCDGSIHHGTTDEFMAAVRGGHVAPGPGPGPTPPTEEDIVAITSEVAANGSLHVFVEAKDGSIWYTWQPKDSTSWHGGQPGKQVAGLSPFAPAPPVKS
jgi:hypothetical protein